MTSMSSDYEDSEDDGERSECGGYNKPVCAGWRSFMQQRDNFCNKWKYAKKRLAEEKALQLERDNELSKVRMQKQILKNHNMEYVNAILEVAKKCFTVERMRVLLPVIQLNKVTNNDGNNNKNLGIPK